MVDKKAILMTVKHSDLTLRDVRKQNGRHKFLLFCYTDLGTLYKGPICLLGVSIKMIFCSCSKNLLSLVTRDMIDIPYYL